MTDHAEQAAKDAGAQPGDSQDRHDAGHRRDHEPDAPCSSDQRQFSDFALI